MTFSEDVRASPDIWMLAKSEAEREDVFQFRYARYFGETQHLPGVDHARQRVFLPHDDASTHFLVRSNEGETLAVGTATPSNAPDIVPVWREVFHLERLRPLRLENIVIISRLVILPNHRHSLFVGQFFVHLLRHCIEQGYRYAVHYCTLGMLPFYERLGYRRYAEACNLAPADAPQTVGPLRIPLILAPFDGQHLRRVRSLFRDVPEGPFEDMEPLLRALPELATPPLCALGTAERKAVLAAYPDLPPATLDTALPLLKRAALLPLREGQHISTGSEPETTVLVLSGQVAMRSAPDGDWRSLPPGSFVQTGGGTESRMGTAGHLAVFHNLRLPQP